MMSYESSANKKFEVGCAGKAPAHRLNWCYIPVIAKSIALMIESL
mgnify:CR=1 FL=1